MPSKSLYQISTSPRKTLSGAARQLSRRESFCSCRYSVLSSPFRGSWHGVSRDCEGSPRKGAKTFYEITVTHNFLYHPRKGAKTNADRFRIEKFMYHPRKGTKKLRIKRCGVFSFANLNFLFSVGYSSMNGTIAAAVIFSLLRLLHSDKMCYNKANSKHLLQNQQIHFPFIVQFFHNP